MVAENDTAAMGSSEGVREEGFGNINCVERKEEK